MLENLDFADEYALLSSTMKRHLQPKTSKLEDKSAKVEVKLNVKKCKVLKVTEEWRQPDGVK